MRPSSLLSTLSVALISLGGFTRVVCADVANGSSKLNIKPGSWNDQLVLEGPDGQRSEFVNGSPVGATREQMLPKSLTAEQRAMLLAEMDDEPECLGAAEIPTVDAFIQSLTENDSEQGSHSKLEILEATPGIVRFRSDFTTALMTEKPFRGISQCEAKFVGDGHQMTCTITWQTPPYARQQSKLSVTGKRVGGCVPDTSSDDAEDANEAAESQDSAEPNE